MGSEKFMDILRIESRAYPFDHKEDTITQVSSVSCLQSKGEIVSTSSPAHPSQSVARDQALSHVYQTYGHIVLRICREVLRQQQDAEDAMHEAFLKYWRYAEQLSEPKEIVGLLRRIALSTAIDFLRYRQRQGRYNETWQEIHDVLHSDQVHPDHENQSTARKIVSMLLQTLRVDDDTVVMAYHYYFDEMTLEEVAEHTGYSRRSVGMKLQRFREHALKYCRNHNISW